MDARAIALYSQIVGWKRPGTMLGEKSPLNEQYGRHPT